MDFSKLTVPELLQLKEQIDAQLSTTQFVVLSKCDEGFDLIDKTLEFIRKYRPDATSQDIARNDPVLALAVIFFSEKSYASKVEVDSLRRWEIINNDEGKEEIRIVDQSIPPRPHPIRTR